MAFIFIAMMISNVKHLFMCLLAIYRSSLEKVSIQVFCPFLTSFFFNIISMNYLYILDINPLLVTQFANIFYHLAGCLFILPMVSFSVQKLELGRSARKVIGYPLQYS